MKEGNDFFSHGIIAKKMSEIFSLQNYGGTFVVAINGAWGTGKTHLMTKALSELDDLEYIKVNFNAWRYAEKEDVRRALLICIIEACRNYVEDHEKWRYLGRGDEERKEAERMLEDAERALYTAFVREIPGEVSIDTGNLIKAGVNMALKFVPWGDFGNEFVQKFFSKKGRDTESEDVCLEKEDVEELWGIFTRSSTKRNIEKVTGVEQFRKSFETLLGAVLEGKYEKSVKKEKSYGNGRKVKLVVAIDDLDRCLPEDALNVLEGIKLFVDYPNTYFMIAMDGEIIQKGLNMRYNGYESIIIRAKDYYEKMIDLSFNIPALVRGKFFSYIRSLSANGEDYIKIFDVLFIALGANLRAWQRYIQRTDFNRAIIEEIAETDIFSGELMIQVYMKLQCFSYQWPELYQVIYDKETYLELEKQIGQVVDPKKKNIEKILDELQDHGIGEEVRSGIIDKKIIDFMLMKPKLKQVTGNDLDLFFTFDKTFEQ
ncbi:MAG: KAP family NTPase [Lachnospiraceae bacterium]|nr:KAP family NTPase [Lachnospiraceae bacterium]